MCARRAEIFRELCNSFARVGRNICVVPTLNANIDNSINSRRRCEICKAHAGRVHAFFCARRVPDFQNFCNFLRDFCTKFASPRRWTLALSCIRTHTDSQKSCNEIMRFAQPRWSSSRSFSARGAPKIFGNFAIFFARVRRKICVIPTLDACFFGSEFNADSANSRRRREACTAHAGRVHAFFCVRGVPDFQKFCNFFSGSLHKIRVTPTLDSRVILH